MKRRVTLYVLLLFPIIILFASLFVNDEMNDHSMEGRYIPPFESLYELQLCNDKPSIDNLSKKEKKIIEKYFDDNDTIILDPQGELIQKTKLINSLIGKDIIRKNQHSFYLLGTDHKGRDLLKMLILATQTNLILSFFAVFFSILMGTVLGIFQGYILDRDEPTYYSKIKIFISYIVESISSIPMLVWLFIILLFNGMILDIYNEYIKNICTFIILGALYYSAILSKSVESHIQSIKKLEFLATSELIGLSKWKITFNHIIRTNLGMLIINQSLMIIIQTIVLEITISFEYFNFGLSSVVSFGSLVNGMFKNPQSMNMIIPVVFAGCLCSIINWISLTYAEVKA